MTTRHQRDRDARWGLPVPPGRKHGSRSYSAKVYGCPCRVCLPSGRRRSPHGEGVPHVERQRKLRLTKKGKPVPPGMKHGLYTYRVYACRCDICRAIQAERSFVQRNAWRATATGRWDENESRTIVHWPPVGEGIWTCPDCGIQLRHRARPNLKEAA